MNLTCNHPPCYGGGVLHRISKITLKTCTEILKHQLKVKLVLCVIVLALLIVCSIMDVHCLNNSTQ